LFAGLSGFFCVAQDFDPDGGVTEVGALAKAFSAACVLRAADSKSAVLALASFALAVTPVRIVMSGARGRDLIAALKGTGTLVLVYGSVLGIGLALD
jgi:1,4-dihydroxy-2-naphthoate octaprenyltransferase